MSAVDQKLIGELLNFRKRPNCSQALTVITTKFLIVYILASGRIPFLPI
jgi:hypothetical protein